MLLIFIYVSSNFLDSYFSSVFRMQQQTYHIIAKVLVAGAGALGGGGACAHALMQSAAGLCALALREIHVHLARGRVIVAHL